MEIKQKLILFGIFFLFLSVFILCLLSLTQAIVDWETFYNQHQYLRYTKTNPSKRNVIMSLIGLTATAIFSSQVVIGTILIALKIKRIEQREKE